MKDFSVLILRSEDGQDWTYAVLYPTAWTSEHADQQAVEALKAGQSEKPEEWSWEDLEPEFIKRGFIIPYWHHGPYWDEQRRTPIIL